MTLYASKQRVVLIAAVSAILVMTLLAGCSSSESRENDPAAGGDISNDSIVVKEVDFTRNFIGNSDVAMTMYATEDGTVIYDMDLDKTSVVQDGQTLRFDSVGDAGLTYILRRGYPYVTYKNNKGMDAYITQMAIWWYLSEDKLSSEFKEATGDDDEFGIVSSTKKLVEAARSANGGDVESDSRVAKIYTTGDEDAARMVGLF